MHPTLSSARKHFVFTSESVSDGHPDKVCDQISDTVLDLYLASNPQARVAAEVLATTNRVVIAGETRGTDKVSTDTIEQAIRAKIKDIGYEQDGFHWQNVKIENHLHTQSADIAMGVDAAGSKDEGAGDQGIMFGFACNDSANYMPAPINIANHILLNLADARRGKDKGFLLPDAKSQVTLEYVDGKPVRAKSIVLSTQHKDGMSQSDIREMVRPYVMKALPNADWMCQEKEFYVNPTGNFVIGGPDGDAGLTGRKIIVDTYGGAAPHGGGAFSGKDPTKVDRSAAYAARYLAKNVVASGVADRCLIQISYAIGVSHPISFYVNTAGTSKVDESRLETLLQDLVDLSPRGIREHLKLNRPIYADTAAYGHFGRNPTEAGGFSWEKCDLVDEIKRHFN